MRRWTGLVALLLGGAAPATALETTALEATVELTPSEVTVGDRIQAIVLVRYDGATAPTLPPGIESWGPVEVLSARPLPPSPAEEVGWRLELVAFEVGELVLPGLPVVLDGELVEVPTAGATLIVRSVLPDGVDEPEPMPPAAPRLLPRGDRFWWTAATLLGLCALGALLIGLRRRTLAAAPIALPIQTLLDALAGLDEQEPEAVHVGVSTALRGYLEATLGVPALERTTREIQGLLEVSQVATAQRPALLELLRRCDEVKFTGRGTTRSEARARVSEATEAGRAIDRSLTPAPDEQDAAS